MAMTLDRFMKGDMGMSPKGRHRLSPGISYRPIVGNVG